jgi:hypothetical protein
MLYPVRKESLPRMTNCAWAIRGCLQPDNVFGMFRNLLKSLRIPLYH